MELISSTSEIQNYISFIKHLNKGFITNFFLSVSKQQLYINDKLLYTVKMDNTVFIFLKIHNYYKLFYFSSSYDDLKNDLIQLKLPSTIIICEIIKKGSFDEENNILENNGFKKYSRLIHFTKKMKNTALSASMPSCLDYACIDDFNEIKSIMEQSFNKYIDINMTDSEIKQYINDKNVLLLKDSNVIAGFVIFDIKNGRAHGIMGGVRPEYKNSYLSIIMHTYAFKLYDTAKFFSGFVREDNTYLLDYYRKLHYIEDGLQTVIYYKENNLQHIEPIIPMN